MTSLSFIRRAWRPLSPTPPGGGRVRQGATASCRRMLIIRGRRDGGSRENGTRTLRKRHRHLSGGRGGCCAPAEVMRHHERPTGRVRVALLALAMVGIIDAGRICSSTTTTTRQTRWLCLCERPMRMIGAGRMGHDVVRLTSSCRVRAERHAPSGRTRRYHARACPPRPLVKWTTKERREGAG